MDACNESEFWSRFILHAQTQVDKCNLDKRKTMGPSRQPNSGMPTGLRHAALKRSGASCGCVSKGFTTKANLVSRLELEPQQKKNVLPG